MDTKSLLQQYGIAPLPAEPVEAMAYVPFQPYQPEMCKPVLGYENGTMFKALHKPFCGSRCGGTQDD